MKITLSRKAYFSSGVTSSDGHNHGHDFELTLSLSGEQSKETGLVVNLTDVKHSLNEALIAFDHKHLQKDLQLKDESGKLVISYPQLLKTLHSKILHHLQIHEPLSQIQFHLDRLELKVDRKRTYTLLLTSP